MTPLDTLMDDKKRNALLFLMPSFSAFVIWVKGAGAFWDYWVFISFIGGLVAVAYGEAYQSILLGSTSKSKKFVSGMLTSNFMGMGKVMPLPYLKVMTCSIFILIFSYGFTFYGLFSRLTVDKYIFGTLLIIQSSVIFYKSAHFIFMRKLDKVLKTYGKRPKPKT